MYIQASYNVTDVGKLHAFIRQYPFAMFVTHENDGIGAAHIPILLDAPNKRLIGHIAKANTQWKSGATSACAIFQGPHTYISPVWYGESGFVPTWNYVAVHVHGKVKFTQDKAQLIQILSQVVATFEIGAAAWRFDSNNSKMQGLLDAIVGFELSIDRIEGQWKLSQNHTPDRQARVVAELRKQSNENAQGIATLMEANLQSWV